MNKSEIIDFLKEHFDCCPKNVIEMCQIYTEYDYDEPFKEYYNYFKDAVGASKVMNGISKLVVFFDAYPNYVFKIPFYGYLEIPEADEDDYKDCAALGKLCPWYSRDDIKYYKCASHDNEYPVLNDDYCAAEAYLYTLAKKAKVASMLAKTIYLGKVCGLDVYVSECVPSEYNCNIASKTSKHSVDRARKILTNSNKKYNLYSELYAGELAIFIENYGVNAAKRLINFVNENHIGDFHSGNFGIDANGRIKIIDYSGFYDDEVFS